MVNPVLIHVPHSSRNIPEDVRDGISLSNEALTYELDKMTDSYTDLLAISASHEVTPANIWVNEHSRLVVDVERFPDERETMNTVGMGVIYTKTHDKQILRTTVDSTLVDKYYHPYAEELTIEVAKMLKAHNMAIIVDLHSYPSERLPYELALTSDSRPQICIGSDNFHTPAWLVEAAQEAFNDYDISINSPFSGTYVPLVYYSADSRVSSIMLEIRRDVYMDEYTMKLTDGFDQVTYAMKVFLQAITVH